MIERPIHARNVEISVYPRHGDHHHSINIKYGYIIFCISLIYMGLIFLAKQYDLYRWRKSGRPKQLAIPIWAHVLIWSVIIILIDIIYIRFPEEYVIAVKRFGRISYCLIPFNIFLVIRPNYFINYLEIINLHKWISRLIIISGILHGSGYFYKWLIEGTLIQKSLRLLNSLGVVIFLISLILLVVSIKQIRRFNYYFFYVFHNITVWLFVILISFHARPGVSVFTLINLLLLAFQIYLRFDRSYKVDNLEVINNNFSSLQLIKISKPPNYPNWISGSHIRLSYSNKWYLPTHPYTISSISPDESIELIVKKTNRFKISKQDKYLLSDPYSSLSPIFFRTAENVSIICGGSGISFGLPILKQLKLSTSAIVNLTWCVRSKDDIFVLKNYQYNENIQIYITGGNSNGQSNDSLNVEEDIELHLLSSSDSIPNNASAESKSLEPQSYYGRPNFNQIFESRNQTDDLANKWLIACGPESLIKDSETWAKINKVQFMSEIYEM